ncbi:hypothetical protein Goklo_022956, partial [Gossypium klotzschianum]|nr:hypothetical protein [Gossypium klotzschianum]
MEALGQKDSIDRFWVEDAPSKVRKLQQKINIDLTHC